MNRFGALNGLLCFVFAIGLAFGQIMFKLAATSISQRLPEGILKAILSPGLIAALICYGLITMLWVFILTRLPLTVAYPFSLLGSGLVPLLAYFLLGEPLAVKQMAGLATVALGLMIMYVW